MGEMQSAPAGAKRALACLFNPPVIGAVAALIPYAVFLVPNGSIIEGGDYRNFQLPLREYAREEILASRLPIWIPYLSCGTPMHAGQQVGLAYLPVTLAILAFSANVGMKLSIFLHMTLCYVGQYRLTRLFNISPLASTFAAIVACNSGFVIFHLMEGHTNILLVNSYVPWFFWALVRTTRDSSAINAVLLSIVTVPLLIAGQPQILYYCLLIGGVWTAGSLLRGVASAHRFAFLGWACIAALLTILLSSIQLLPTFELTRNGIASSERGTLDYARGHAADALDTLTFWWPTYFGSRHAHTTEFPYPADRGFVHERTNYLGILVPILGILGLAKRTENWQWPMVGLIGLCFVIALGPNTPLFRLIGPWIPGFFTFRCPARTLAIVAVLAPVLAARGIDSLVNRLPWKTGTELIGVAALAWVVVNAVVIALWTLWDLGAPYVSFVATHLTRELSTCGILTVIAVGIIVAIPYLSRISKTAAYVAVIWFALNDLWFTNGQHIQLGPPKSMATMDRPKGDPNVRILDAPAFPRISEIGLRYSSLVPVAIQNRWTSVGTNEGGVQPKSTALLNLAIIRNTKPSLAAASVNWVWVGGPWNQLTDSIPRARFIAREAEDLCEIPIDKLEATHVELLTKHSTTCTIESDLGAQLVVTVTAPGDGTFVLADTYFPGWACRTGERKLEIIPIHGAFRGVQLSAGTHRLVFEYEPLSLRIGFVLSALGLVLTIACACYGTIKSNRIHLDQRPI